MSQGLRLSQVAVGELARVGAIDLPPREAAWLRAVGLFEGTTLRLLRRAPLGGPLHLRTSSGAEFAIDRQLAAAIAVVAEAEAAAS